MALRIFISHSHQDNIWCDQFINKIAEQYDVDIWYDQKGLFAGDEWIPTLEREIEEREIFLIILTPSSWASRWVQKEYQLALGLHKRIVGVMYLPVNLSGFITTYQILNYINFNGSAAGHQAGIDLKATLKTLANITSVDTSSLLAHNISNEDRQPYLKQLSAQKTSLEPAKTPVLDIVIIFIGAFIGMIVGSFVGGSIGEGNLGLVIGFIGGAFIGERVKTRIKG